MIKNINFFCPECLDCVNHQEKLISWRTKLVYFSWTLAENQTHQISSSNYKHFISCMCRSNFYTCRSNFPISECHFLNLEKQKRLQKFPIHPLQNHLLPPIPGFPPFLAKIFYPPYESHFWKISSLIPPLSSPLWRGQELDYANLRTPLNTKLKRKPLNFQSTYRTKWKIDKRHHLIGT